MSEPAGVQRFLCSIGSNIDPFANLPKALLLLVENFSPLVISRVLQTRPHHMDTRKRFLNALLAFDSDRSVTQVKSLCNGIETVCGRDREHPGSSQNDREVDIDILACGRDCDPRAVVANIEYLRELGDDFSMARSAPPKPEGVVVYMCGARLGQRAATIHLDALAGDVRVVDEVIDRFQYRSEPALAAQRRLC